MLNRFKNIVFVGDYNAKIGNLNQCHQDFVISPHVFSIRKTRCYESNNRGLSISDTLENNGFIVLNGRTTSDFPANFTYVDHGHRIIDLAWCRLHCIDVVLDFKVLDLSISDHLPCVVNLNLSGQSNCTNYINNPVPRIRPTKDNVEIFRNLMIEMPQISDFDEFKEFIVNACGNAGMFHFPSSRSHKPWFNHDCHAALKALRLRIFSSCPTVGAREELVSRRHYLSIVKSTKRLFYEDVQLKLADFKSRSAFWKAVNMYRGRSNLHCSISKAQWEAFYETELPEEDSLDIIDIFPEQLVPELDSAFSVEELMLAIYSSQ